MACYSLAVASNKLFYFDDGTDVRVNIAGVSWIHGVMGVERAVHVLCAAIVCASLVQVPLPQEEVDEEDGSVKEAKQAGGAFTALLKKYVPDTHMAVFLLIACGINSNRLSEEVVRGDFVEQHLHVSAKEATAFVRHALLIVHMAFFAMGLGAAALNMTTLRPALMRFSDKALARCAGALIFVFQFGIITAHFVTLHPHSLAEAVSDRVDASTLRDRHTEFILDACIDWSLSLIGVALAFVSSPTMDAGDPRADRNRFAGTFVFNNVFLGAALAKIAFRAAGGTRAPIIILWRVAIAAGVMSGVIACFSASSPWFTFTVEAGTIPKETGIHAENVEDLISELGHSALGVVKKMMDCNCRAAGACDCETMHAARAHVATKRQDKVDFAATSNISYVHDEVTHFDQITQDVMYNVAMKKCHEMECDIFLGVAVAAESSILASGTVWLTPGLEDAISTAAWFGQLVNRVGHGVLKYGYRRAKFLTSLALKIKRIRPFLQMVLRLACTLDKARYNFTMDLAMIYVPLALNSAFCVLLVVGHVPSKHMVVKGQMHAGFYLLRYAYCRSALSTFFPPSS
ncbi:Hypothetical Protein FCC1311_117772 [Hondaea fermentalgiana]|uniref:Uncharacterized protein n=1 Tax=Hondaea fermentalgiana TaxID=2315210 RepID=A0A2R5FDB4_9STRA|nr:Hypothetical Protein FCC1311_117772 [Hondaea fermentalgiana]|eukprot:GBG16302.1 Hypothetical Protein FCC1311_117772 [Hondaea fermentalgiana]